MTTPTQEARQRCADLAKEIDGQCWIAADFDEGGEVEARAFARYVQQVSDTAREMDRKLRRIVPPAGGWAHKEWQEICDLARTLILPEPADPLVEAFAASHGHLATIDHAGCAQWLRAYFAKQGKRIEIVEADRG